tara:strand:- start:402 stop:731 length:330 start_codon:yes stop_codon:yes gene_type:complete
MTNQEKLNALAHEIFYEKADQYNPLTPRDFIHHKGMDGIGGELFDYVGESLLASMKYHDELRDASEMEFMKCVIHIIEEMVENWTQFEIEEDEKPEELWVRPKHWKLPF